MKTQASPCLATALPLLLFLQAICNALNSGSGIAEAVAQAAASGNAQTAAQAIAEVAGQGEGSLLRRRSILHLTGSTCCEFAAARGITDYMISCIVCMPRYFTIIVK